MKKHISIILSIALVLSVFFGIGTTAYAAGGASISLSAGSVSADAGETKELTATVTNTLETDLITKFQVTCDDYGLSFSSGDVSKAPGEGMNISLSFQVQQSMLDKTLTFKVQYQTATVTTWTDGGSATLDVKSKVAAINASMTVSPHLMAAAGDVLELKFSVQNTGEATLKNISVKIPGVNSGKMLNSTEFTLIANETKTFSYLYTVSAAATLAPVVYYKVNGAGNTLEYPITPVDITIENRDVQMTFTAEPTNPQAGEMVKLSVDVTNNGNVNYTNVQAYLNGVEVDFPSSTLNAGAHFSKDYELSFLASTTVTFELVMKDQKGEIVNKSKSVSIELPVDENAITSNLTMKVETDRLTLTSPGTVLLTVSINNGTEYEFLNPIVMETTKNEQVYTDALLGAHKSASFEYTVDITETTTFTFQLKVTDTAGNTHTVDAEPITIDIASAVTGSAYPSAADITPTGETDGNGSSASSGVLIFFIILVVLVIGVGVALLVLWRTQRGGSRPSGGRPSGGSKPSGGKPVTTVKKRPVAGPVKRKKPAARSFRDRNFF